MNKEPKRIKISKSRRFGKKTEKIKRYEEYKANKDLRYNLYVEEEDHFFSEEKGYPQHLLLKQVSVYNKSVPEWYKLKT